MKFAFEIKMEPVTQAAIIAPSSRSPPDLSRRPIYAQNPPVSIICSVNLAIIVYLALRFSPR
jgi:hypothetical protein